MYKGSWWPNLEDLKMAGIEYKSVIQYPGDLVYVGPGTWHWVQSLGKVCRPKILPQSLNYCFIDDQRCLECWTIHRVSIREGLGMPSEKYPQRPLPWGACILLIIHIEIPLGCPYGATHIRNIEEL